MTEPHVLRAFHRDGTRELRGPLVVPDPQDGEWSQEQLVAAASAAVGVPVALLGRDGVEAVVVEVLADPGSGWVDAELPEGWRERAPWRQPGWYAGAVTAIDERLANAGRRRTGPAVQTKHWSISALMRVPTDAGDVWFKQVPPMFAHEGKLVRWLADLAPDVIRAPLAVGEDWWIAQDLGPACDVPAGSELGSIEVLTALQWRATGRQTELLELGCPDRRLPTLVPAVVDVLEREDVLAPEPREQLQALLPRLSEAVEQLASTALPDTLVHGDFHGGNQRFTASGWVIYDWTDGCLSHPLVDLAPAGTGPEGRSDRLALTRQLWRQRFPRLSEQDLRCGLIAGAAHQVVTYQRIADGVERSSAGMWGQEGTACATALICLLEELR